MSLSIAIDVQQAFIKSTLSFNDSQYLFQGFLLFLYPRISPSHVNDPDPDGHDHEEAADNEIDPPQIGDDVGRGSLKVEDAGAENGLDILYFSLSITFRSYKSR